MNTEVPGYSGSESSASFLVNNGGTDDTVQLTAIAEDSGNRVMINETVTVRLSAPGREVQRWAVRNLYAFYPLSGK